MNDLGNRPLLMAVMYALIAFGIGVAALFAVLGSPGPNVVEAVVRLAMTAIVPALIVGFTAKRAASRWSAWKIAAWYVVALFVVVVLQALGHRA